MWYFWVNRSEEYLEWYITGVLEDCAMGYAYAYGSWIFMCKDYLYISRNKIWLYILIKIHRKIINQGKLIPEKLFCGRKLLLTN